MNLLLDTHVLIWYTANDFRLPISTRFLIDDPYNVIYVSVVSCWEIAIKLGLEKLELDMSIEDLLDLKSHGLCWLEISSSDIKSYSKLNFPLKDHRDPFDRMISVQARERGITLITADAVFSAYLPPNQLITL